MWRYSVSYQFSVLTSFVSKKINVNPEAENRRNLNLQIPHVGENIFRIFNFSGAKLVAHCISRSRDSALSYSGFYSGHMCLTLISAAATIATTPLKKLYQLNYLGPKEVL